MNYIHCSIVPHTRIWLFHSGCDIVTCGLRPFTFNIIVTRIDIVASVGGHLRLETAGTRMKLHMVMFLLQCSLVLVTSEDVPETREFVDNTDDYDDLGRKHRKKKKHQSNPCFGGYGRTFGSHDQTYVSAPVTNYFFSCGGPVAPAQYPVQFGGGHGHGGHGHGSHGHGGHGHGSHSHGGHGQGGHGSHGYGGHGHGGFNGPVNYGYNQGYNQPYQFGQYQPFNGPQNVVAAAASGFGNAVAGYFNRPRKVNRQINQFLRPLYNLF